MSTPIPDCPQPENPIGRIVNPPLAHVGAARTHLDIALACLREAQGALNQNATFPADVRLAKAALANAVALIHEVAA